MPDRPLILGAGPAGCAAAIMLASAGANPILIDSNHEVGDALCGGFLSWRTASQLMQLGIDPRELGAHHVRELRIFARERVVRHHLPLMAYGLSRRALDKALRKRAVVAGAEIGIDHVRKIEAGRLIGENSTYSSDSIFLATGKHDVRGKARPRITADPSLGLRLRLPPSPTRDELLNGAIELHLFKGGYAGIVLQEGGSANICLALRKSVLAEHGGQPQALFGHLASSSPLFAKRLGDCWQKARIDSIGAVPYGYIAPDTEFGMFRLGDQAAVIPSLAGEGISIAVASGILAASCWLERGAVGACVYQQAMARAAARPVRLAGLLRSLAETRLGAQMTVHGARLLPSLVDTLADATRIRAKSRLAPVAWPA